MSTIVLDIDDFISYLTVIRKAKHTTLRIHLKNLKLMTELSMPSFEKLLATKLKCNIHYGNSQNNTLNSYISTFNTVVDYCNERGIAHSLKKWKYYPKFQPEIEPLSLEEMRKLLGGKVAYSPQNGYDGEKLDRTYHFITHFMLMTGARLNETLELRVKDLSVPNKWARLRFTKSGKPRNAYLFEPVLSALAALSKGKELDDHIFTNLKNGKIHDTSYRLYLQLLSKNVEVRKTRPHLLRHSFATILLRHGAKLVEISDILGHSDINITRKIYLHLTDDEQRQASARNPLVSSSQEAQSLVDQYCKMMEEYFFKDSRFDKTKLREAMIKLQESIKK